MTALTPWWTDTVTVEAWQGATATGHAYATSVTVVGRVEHTRRLVRGPDASQQLSETTVYLPAIAGLAGLPARSRVTLPGGQVTTALTTTRQTGPGPLGAIEHWEIACE